MAEEGGARRITHVPQSAQGVGKDNLHPIAKLIYHHEPTEEGNQPDNFRLRRKQIAYIGVG